MFEGLQDKLAATFKKLRGQGVIKEANIQDALRDVRMSLLEADVNFKVVKDFIDHVKDRAMGADVLNSLTPDQQFIKIVHDELAMMMGGENRALDLSARPPVVILMVGLQGSGKTTSSGKLARLLKSQGKSPYLVPADVYRPAAIEQLKKLAETLLIPVYPTQAGQDPIDIAKAALEEAGKLARDIVIIDTAGRLAIDEEMMVELDRLVKAIKPKEILFVADAMTGQDAVNTAQTFNQRLDITGVILTKMDGDARGGAALSIRSVTGKPVKFVGMGEKMDALEPFHPDRMAQRILGMGDVMSLIEKAQENYDEKEAEKLRAKLTGNSFTLEDFLAQIQSMKKMGSITDLLDKLPGMGKEMRTAMDAGEDPEREFKRIEAMIHSMTKQERRNSAIINGSRRRRIANGSGTTVQAVNKLLKDFLTMKQVMQSFKKMGLGGVMKKMMGAGGAQSGAGALMPPNLNFGPPGGGHGHGGKKKKKKR